VLSGSLPGGLAEEYYARIIKLVRTKGAYAALDASGEALRQGCGACPDLVKPNAVEGVELSGLPAGNPLDMARIAQAIHDLGARYVVISAGKEGALAFDGQISWLAKAPAITEDNPTGAGDAMLAGLVFGLDGGKELADALALGAACGAAAAGMPGTAMPAREQVDALLKNVTVKELSG
jgi:1-phosphofructokinase family hexose kinase